MPGPRKPARPSPKRAPNDFWQKRPKGAYRKKLNPITKKMKAAVVGEAWSRPPVKRRGGKPGPQ